MTNSIKLAAWFIVEAALIAAGVGIWAALHAGDSWLIAWVILAIIAGSLIASYCLFPIELSAPPLPPGEVPPPEAGRSFLPAEVPPPRPGPSRQPGDDLLPGPDDYNLAHIRQLLVEGFTADELHRLLRYQPSLRPIDLRLGPADGMDDMVDVILSWTGPRLILHELLTAAERANPRRYALHRPYFRQDTGQPARPKTYDLARIQALFEQIFDSESLYSFCRERAGIWPIWKEISSDDHLARMIYRVLACAERQVLLEDLLAEIQAAYPAAYEQGKPYEQERPQ